MKIIERIKADPRVEDVWDEGEDGLWIALKSGYCWPGGGTHAVHEWSLTELWKEFKTVEVCHCKDCEHDRIKPLWKRKAAAQ